MSKKNLLGTAATAYLLLVLAVLAILTPEPFPVAAAVLLVLQAVLLLFPAAVGSGLKFCITLATFALLPVVALPLLGIALSAAVALPVLIAVNQRLKEYAGGAALNEIGVTKKPGMHLTPLATTILAATFSILAASVALSEVSLMMASLILVVDVLLLMFYALRRIPAEPLECTGERRRVLAGERLSVAAQIRSGASVPLRVALAPSLGWMSLDRSEICLFDDHEETIAIDLAPPLAAPSNTTITASAADPWGMISFAQELHPVDLHVVPRARYAEWLANKYLGQTAPGYFPSMATPPIRESRHSRRGVEYYGSRLYQPGDKIRDVDWRQTFKLQELVVREFSGGQSQPFIIAVGLTAGDAEDADRLAYDLITSALTMAKRGVPVAIAAYNNEGVVDATGIINPREALKKAMLLSERMAIEPAPERVIGPVDPLRLSRNISLLRRTSLYENEAGDLNGENLERVLDMEYRSVNASASKMPVSLALKKVVDKVPPPAAVLSVASRAADENALRISMKSLKAKGYRIIEPGLFKEEVKAIAR